MPTLSKEPYTFDPRPDYPFLISANRYFLPSSPYINDEEALTLICTHGTGFHKEQWEPTLEHLFALIGDQVKIREVWSIDAPNHGDGAVLNEHTLQWGYEPTFSWEEYARSVHLFLSSLGTGVNVDFSKRKLVGIGHSMGAIALMLSTTFQPQVHYTSLILVEPMLLGPNEGKNTGNMLESGAMKRRDIWESKEKALAALEGRASFKVWDGEMLRNFVEYGLRPLPTAKYPDKTEGVTLKCTKIQEAATYRSSTGRVRGYLLLPVILKRAPTHIIWGAVDDYLPPSIKNDVLNTASGGYDNWASVSRVEGSGHLIPQTKPHGLAEKIKDTLSMVSGLEGRGNGSESDRGKARL